MYRNVSILNPFIPSYPFQMFGNQYVGGEIRSWVPSVQISVFQLGSLLPFNFILKFSKMERVAPLYLYPKHY